MSPAPLLSPNLQRFYIVSSVINRHVMFVMGEANPVLTNGYGGWSIVQRPQRKSLTNWDGHAPFQLALDGWFSEVARDLSIEDSIQDLETMAKVDTTLNPNRPPVVKIFGDPLPIEAKSIDWVIQDLVWGKTIRSVDHIHRIQQQVTITLLEYVSGGLVHESGIKPGGGLLPAYRNYTVRKGDTLKSIAKKFLGKESRWQEIARVNHLHDPRNLKVGSKIRVPRK